MMRAVADHLWQSTWCALAIWLWLLSWRAGFARVRHGLLLLATGKFLLPLALLYALGAKRGYPVPHVEVAPPADIVAAVDATHPIFWPAAYLPEATPAVGVWLAAAWAAGALYFAVRWLSSWRRTWRALRLAAPMPAECALETRLSPAVAVPTVIGAWRPVLLLPVGSQAILDDTGRAAVFAYAQEFAARRYYQKAQLQRLIETVFWFHPLVWRIGRDVARAAEHACDEAVVASGFDARAYADGIIAATSVHQPPDADWALRGVQLAQRPPPRPLGFVRAAAVSACAWVILMQAPLSGAVHARLHRQEVMRADAATLRDARFDLAVAAPGMGERSQVLPRADGVFIRNVNLKELLAISYGVRRSAITSRQMITAESSVADDHWLYTPRWDIRITARLREPRIFEPYALHEPVTRLLVAQFGFEINVNGKCQDPCGRHSVPMPQEGL